MQSKENLRRELEGREEVRRFISPTLVLCQLHVGAVDPDKIIDHIMEFDADAIEKAICKLQQRGFT